jgi:hypothetical protein
LSGPSSNDARQRNLLSRVTSRIGQLIHNLTPFPRTRAVNSSRDTEWTPKRKAAIRADLRLGKAGTIKLAAAHGVGVGTVQRIKAAGMG